MVSLGHARQCEQRWPFPGVCLCCVGGSVPGHGHCRWAMRGDRRAQRGATRHEEIPGTFTAKPNWRERHHPLAWPCHASRAWGQALPHSKDSRVRQLPHGRDGRHERATGIATSACLLPPTRPIPPQTHPHPQVPALPLHSAIAGGEVGGDDLQEEVVGELALAQVGVATGVHAGLQVVFALEGAEHDHGGQGTEAAAKTAGE